MTWTRFMDMHSGGFSKEKWQYIYIEASEEEARAVFYSRFGHNPDRVTCTCCGPDYSICEEQTLDQITAFERGCAFAWFRPDGTECEQGEAWQSGVGTNHGYTSRYVNRPAEGYRGKNHKALSEHISSDDVKVIYSKDIQEHERVTDVPEQGYVWVD